MRATARFWSFVFAGFIFWFFANQTHVGWLYVIASILGGVTIAAWFLNRGTLKRIVGERHLKMDVGAALHEGDSIGIRLTLKNKGNLPASHLSLVETCPLAAPDSEQYELPMFIPMLSDRIEFEYETTVHRRGLHQFPANQIASRAPFGFFERKGKQTIPTSVLVYPEIRKLSHLSLLDEQPAAELTNPSAGIGSEVIGVRPYRAGDSPRHIHWRSVARRGQLVSKEFAQETQPGVSVVLDRFCPLDPIPETKHQPFEMAIKSVVSIAEYAMRKGYPVHIAADNEGMAVPQGAIVWDALMQYSARVPTSKKSNLADVLTYQPMQQFVAIALSWIDESIIETLISMKHRGYNMIVIVPELRSYPIESDLSVSKFVDALEYHGIAYCVLKHGDDWAKVISYEQEFVAEAV